MVEVYPHLGGCSGPLVGCALTSGGYLGLGLLALSFFFVLVFQFSSYTSFTICRVTKASGCVCGASSTPRQLHRVRGLDEWRPAAASPSPTTLSWTSGWSATSCCGPIDTASPNSNKKNPCCFCSNNNQTAICFCLFYLLCFVVRCTDCHAAVRISPGQCILMGYLWIPGRLFLAHGLRDRKKQ